MANFSQTCKITYQMFSLWCQLLRQEANNRGIDPRRIFFTAHLSTQQHLNRFKQADLVVDTYPYGGHTLTSDALWAGTPVVTMMGETFASRVAASLLMNVGMGELVVHNDEEFFKITNTMLHQCEQLSTWRQYLDNGRSMGGRFKCKPTENAHI